MTTSLAHKVAFYTSVLALPLMLLASACGTPDSKERGEEAAATKTSDASPADETSAASPTADSRNKGKASKPAGASTCCKYCLDTIPDGDSCVDRKKAPDSPAPGCACPGEERPLPKFSEGQRIRGLIAADVYPYNTAQGDPIDGPFTLEQAFAGDDTLLDAEGGKLIATFVTDLGEFKCDLFEKEAPLTVANFVGLARGTRPVLDKKTKKWATRPFYDHILFHRVIPGFMIQTGDPLGSGTGGPGYFVADEFDPKLRHSSAGILSMANRNQKDPRTQKPRVDPKTGQHIGNTGSSQFFVTVDKTPHLDGMHTIFGKCGNAKVPKAISKVPTKAIPEAHIVNRPAKDVYLQTIKITRER